MEGQGGFAQRRPPAAPPAAGRCAHLSAAAVTRSRTMRFSMWLKSDLLCTLGRHTRRVLQRTSCGGRSLPLLQRSTAAGVRRLSCGRPPASSPGRPSSPCCPPVAAVLANVVARQHSLAGKQPPASALEDCASDLAQTQRHAAAVSAAMRTARNAAREGQWGLQAKGGLEWWEQGWRLA